MGTHNWEFGDAGDRHPVVLGDVWRCGPHVLACLDLETGKAMDFIATYVPQGIDLFYSDPPWSTGNAKFFRTIAKNKHEGVNLKDLFARILPIAAQAKGHTFIEMGNLHEPDLLKWMEELGFTSFWSWGITYIKNKPCRLVHGIGPAGSMRLEGRPEAEGMDDEETPGWAMNLCTKPGETVFDSCIGQGCTPAWAQRLGRRFAGTELNPRRMAVALDRLMKLGAGTPEKIGEL